MRLALTQIRTDGGTFARASLSEATIIEYAEALQNGCIFPPLTVFLEPATGNYWLADGHHRYHAFSRIGFKEIEVDLKVGTLREAILYAVGANASHGLRRSPADKRHAVMMLLQDAEWNKYSDRSIAILTRTSHPFVAKIRNNLTGNVSSKRLYHNRYGDLGYMETEKIGKSHNFSDKPKTLKIQPAIFQYLEQLQQQWGETSLEDVLIKVLNIPSSPSVNKSPIVPTTNKRTLGIDPALGTLRWAVLEPDDDYDLPRLLDYGTITTTPKRPTSQRLSELEQDLVEILKEFAPSDVAIEIPYLNTESEQNPKNIQNALEAIGVVDLVCFRERQISPVRLYAGQWKSHICDYRADTEEITDTIAGLFNLQVRPTERLDAIAIAYAAICGVGKE
ncbi:crossover junction endodeoxyribonuclease RuvC [Gloeothece verrucosa]|uniref:Holliday junction resolvasome endonuclease subunit-like protein n=1 Tax=Gloeothece verrucosa (strain PCC 7822) TaxID=497965 RepID=E0UNG3_GLOV7|nr:crossover junction endodeoxyribonuclease RuvC [Gloeothece verrucosa]ADN18493.1 Holliday junction resolvasome endonuclease subunit-like protein [Gloeothece verrucosa PCC 7822]